MVVGRALCWPPTGIQRLSFWFGAGVSGGNESQQKHSPHFCGSAFARCKHSDHSRCQRKRLPSRNATASETSFYGAEPIVVCVQVSIADYKPPERGAAAGGGDGGGVVAVDVAGGDDGAHAAAEWGLDQRGLGLARLQALQFEQARAMQQQHEGTNYDFLFGATTRLPHLHAAHSIELTACVGAGFVMGIAFGVVAILWLWIRNTPRKRKLGIAL